MALSKVLVPMPSSLSRVYPSPSIILWFVLSVKIHMHTHTYTQKKKKKRERRLKLDMCHINTGLIIYITNLNNLCKNNGYAFSTYERKRKAKELKKRETTVK